MKIIFLCGSLEPSKDGVGDYTRRLAGELIRQKHFCAIISIMDKGVQERLEELQESEGTSVSVVRLPYPNGYKLNCIHAKHWVTGFNPEWISLQYVPFSFHPKGLPIGLGKSIQQLARGRNLHIMFHELWVGMNDEATFKLKLWGTLQRTLLKFLIKKLNPSYIHTQSQLYQWQLKNLDFIASLLPLYSNINVVGHKHIKKELKESVEFVVFGTIHPEVPIENFACCLDQYCEVNGIQAEIGLIGRCGSEQQHWIDIFESKKINIKIYGEQSSQKISEVLNNADIGITTTPLILTDKSGTVAAMKEHGLPILCVSNSWEVKAFSEDYFTIDIELFKEEKFASYMSSRYKNISGLTVSVIANQFLNSLLKI